MQKSHGPAISLVPLTNPDGLNLIFGQSHFIKTVEDIHEAIVSTVPGVRFGAAFSEASGSRLIRTTGTERKLEQLAAKNLRAVACGHVFLIFLENAFPINVLPVLRQVPEIVRFFCATANPVQVVVARTDLGGAVLGVVDGASPVGVESPADRTARKKFLRTIGYKLDV